MNHRPSVAVVEDNPPQRMILCKLLANDYDVSDFASGEDFLASPLYFDGVLMDIEMPGRNGYDTCRALRSRGENNDTPVIFVSAHDTAPERVAAYEAGGEDFVTKPITAHELRHKLHAAIEHRQQLKALAESSNTAQKIAFTAMNAWDLRGAIQIRGQNGSVHLASGGRMSPLQQSVLDTMRDMGRIFEMGSRAIINYERVSLLVENLPTDDPDKVGRLRDHLAVLAESTDMRISGMDAIQERDLQKVGIDGALVELRTTLTRVAEHNHSNRKIGQFHVLEALEHLARAVGTLGLTEAQLNYVDDLVKCTIDDTRHYFDEAAGVETEFADVLARLERLSVSDYRF